MPRQAGIEAPGSLQHNLVRGIERKVVFKKYTDDIAYVLALFGKTVTAARKSHADYVSKCAGAGRRQELTGADSGRSGAVKYEQRIALSSVPGWLNILS